MEKEKSVSSLTVPPTPVFPFPVALYEWNGLIFELYRGGQPYQPALIHWQRVKTVIVPRHNSAFNVEVNQGHPKPRP